MHTPKTTSIRSAVLAIAMGTLASSPYLIAQDTSPPANPSTSTAPAPTGPAQTATNPPGGWRRIGDPPNTPPTANPSQNNQSQTSFTAARCTILCARYIECAPGPGLQGPIISSSRLRRQ